MEKLENINENLVNGVVRTALGGEQILIQSGSDETGRWMKAKFKPGGKTFLFRPEELAEAMAKCRSNAQSGGAPAWRAAIGKGKKVAVGTDTALDFTYDGCLTDEMELAAAFDSALSAAEAEIADVDGLFEAGRTPLSDALMAEKARGAVDDERFDAATANGFGRWYRAGFDVKRKRAVMRRAVGPAIWFGRPVDGDGDLDDAETSLGDLWWEDPEAVDGVS